MTVLAVDELDHDTKELAFSKDVASRKELKSLTTENDYNSLAMSVAVTIGSFGYEEYKWPCSSEMTAAYGYVLGQCSRSSASSSYIYNWCALSEDNTKIFFHVTEYSGTNCSEAELFNKTFWDYNSCDAVNSRQAFCKSSTEGWQDYDFDQHVEVFDDNACTGNMNYWKADDIDCLDFCYISSYRESTRGVCDKFPNDWDDDYCFHVDTKIDYKGVEYSFDELKSGVEPECTVPHTPRARGVVITTSCGLTVRVTDTHLMATPLGFRQAYSLKPGDYVFAGYSNNEKTACVVQAVEREREEQEYFGLNCLHSEVLSSGLRASTFGDFHTLPSWFMAYVGAVVGIEAASNMGTRISEIFYRM